MKNDIKHLMLLVIVVVCGYACSSDATIVKEETEISTMDSSTVAIDDHTKKLEEQTKKVETDLEKLDSEFENTK